MTHPVLYLALTLAPVAMVYTALRLAHRNWRITPYKEKDDEV